MTSENGARVVGRWVLHFLGPALLDGEVKAEKTRRLGPHDAREVSQ